MRNTNVLMQELPETLIEAIKQQKNLYRIIFLSKGSTGIYVITYKQEDKEIFNIVSYEQVKISDFIEKIFYTPKEEQNLFQKSGMQKIELFVSTLFEEFKLDSIEIEGNKISREDFNKDPLMTIFLAAL